MNPEIFPSLSTERLFLSLFTREDGEDMFAYARNPKVAETVTWEAHQSVADSLAFIDFVSSKTSLENGSAFVALALRDKRNQKAIGSISFSQFSLIAGQIDYALGVDHWGRGLMTEAAGALVAWAYRNFATLLRVQGRCLVYNHGSRRVMEKLGMRFEGVARAGMLVKGSAVDVATYAILRPEFSNASVSFSPRDIP